MNSAIDTYLTRITLAGMRPATIRVKRVCLTAFAATVPSIRSAQRHDVEAFLSRPLAPRSRRAYADHLKGFYRHLIDEGIRTDDPTDKLPRFREPRRLPRPVTDEQLALALDHADPRMRAWLLLMSLAGLRCMEVSALTPRDLVDTSSGTLLWLPDVKGGGTDTVPAHPAVVEALRALPVRDGVWWTVSPLRVSTDTARYLRSIGVNATAHQLRHWAGTTFYEASGHDLLVVKDLLRHATVATTQIYAKVNPRRPAEVVGLMPWPGRPAA